MKVLSSIKLTQSEFDGLRSLVHRHTGISLSDAKVELVKRRFAPRLKELNLDSFSSYIKRIEDGDTDELLRFTDAITTNLTSFFRENHHFDYMKREILPKLLKDKMVSKRVRFWSAGCSTGQEPYTMAMLLREAIPMSNGWDIKILATDIDRTVLAKARMGLYTQSDLDKMPEGVARKWFTKHSDKYQVKDELRQMITFNQLNLLKTWPVKGPFEAIFCRNVFIYFDKPTQKSIVQKFARVQNSGDHLFIGHSESITDMTDDYKLIGQTTYVRQ